MALGNYGNSKTGGEMSWDALLQEDESSSTQHHDHNRPLKEEDHSLDLPAAYLDPLFSNTNDFESPEFWMNGSGDAWLDQMDNLVGFLQMDQAAFRIPMQRITRRSSDKPQTKRDTSGRKVDGRIRILKKPEPGRSEGNPRPLNIRRLLRILSRSMKRSESAGIPFNKMNVHQKRSNPVRLTRLLNIQKAFRILSQSLK